LSLVDDEKNYTRFDGHFNDHADALVQCGADRLIEHNLGFTQSPWTLPSGNYLHCIAPARPPWSSMAATQQTQQKNFSVTV
jgi:hypothetical protein